jgi:hypothetical protein
MVSIENKKKRIKGTCLNYGYSTGTTAGQSNTGISQGNGQRQRQKAKGRKVIRVRAGPERPEDLGCLRGQPCELEPAQTQLVSPAHSSFPTPFSHRRAREAKVCIRHN